MLAAARGCYDIFHLALPCTVDRVLDPQKERVAPAVEGTLHVLRAAKDVGGVGRVVVTSAISAVVPSPGRPAGEVLDESCWTNIDYYCDKNRMIPPRINASIAMFLHLKVAQRSIRISSSGQSTWNRTR
ncbi:putative anthocyanidin reductase [Triticum urartu]|uniref:3-beta hydroxysteroid dehydrogenase/isomerase domain-containing protein n=1 Tax=Triticum urartu TaxID=4572 RepID=A0A8R7U868_TRIUA|nr:putative anthocyanidin reductase [Triticum urartu]XP_048570590.1 putative anthocyanidin reductase [Triticum urartu]